MFGLGGNAVFGVFGSLFSMIPLLFVGAVAFLYLRTRRPRVPTSTAAAVAAAGHDPALPTALPVGQWNARVSAHGTLPIAGSGGQLRVENGWLGFHSADAVAPTWLVPANQVRAGGNSMLAQSEVWIESAETGRLNLTVSHEHINLIMGNDFKDIRERRYADEFLWMLHQCGAAVFQG